MPGTSAWAILFKNMKNILIISDSVGMGNIATSAMMPILAYMGFSTSSLPTCLVSNNFGYGKYAILDTTGYLREAFPIWEKLGFGFDAIATGFIPSEEQAELISQFCAAQAAKGASIFVDPVMGDCGEFYDGLDTDMVLRSMRKMLSVADLCYPNYTEACLLTGIPYKEEGVSEKEIFEIVDLLRGMGAKSVVITSAKVDGRNAVAGHKAATGEKFLLNYEELPLFFSGTGDVFSAVLIGYLMNGKSLKHSTQKAMDGVYNFILLNKDAKDPYKGLPVEKYLNVL